MRGTVLLTIDRTAGSYQQTDLWPGEGSIEYSPSWSTLVGGDKVTSRSGDTAKFTFTGKHHVAKSLLD